MIDSFKEYFYLRCPNTSHMNLEPYIAVSGVGPLFSLVTSKPNGLVLESLEDGKTKFYSVRKHQFTPLGTVAVYTLSGTTPLQDVMGTMFEKLATTPLVPVKSEKHIIEEYFETILPDYDEDKVPLKDMKKIIKWFGFLNERGLAKPVADSSEEE